MNRTQYCIIRDNGFSVYSRPSSGSWLFDRHFIKLCDAQAYVEEKNKIQL